MPVPYARQVTALGRCMHAGVGRWGKRPGAVQPKPALLTYVGQRPCVVDRPHRTDQLPVPSIKPRLLACQPCCNLSQHRVRGPIQQHGCMVGAGRAVLAEFRGRAAAEAAAQEQKTAGNKCLPQQQLATKGSSSSQPSASRCPGSCSCTTQASGAARGVLLAPLRALGPKPLVTAASRQSASMEREAILQAETSVGVMRSFSLLQAQEGRGLA